MSVLGDLAARSRFTEERGWTLAITADEERELRTLDHARDGVLVLGVPFVIDDDEAMRQRRAMAAGGTDVDQITLGKAKVAAFQAAPAELFRGAQNPAINLTTDFLRDQVVAHVNALVFDEPAGPTRDERVTVTLPIRPRWLPRFLWRRIPTYEATWTMTLEPRWTYPQAGVSFPALGPASLRRNSSRSYVREVVDGDAWQHGGGQVP